MLKDEPNSEVEIFWSLILNIPSNFRFGSSFSIIESEFSLQMSENDLSWVIEIIIDIEVFGSPISKYPLDFLSSFDFNHQSWNFTFLMMTCLRTSNYGSELWLCGSLISTWLSIFHAQSFWASKSKVAIERTEIDRVSD